MSHSQVIRSKVDAHNRFTTREEGMMSLCKLIALSNTNPGSFKIEAGLAKGTWTLFSNVGGRWGPAHFKVAGRLSEVKGFPFSDNHPKSVVKRAPYLFQRAVIDGHQSEYYEEALKGLDVIRHIFEVALGPRATITDLRSMGFYQISAHNPYLTKISHGYAKAAPFSQEEDPQGLLRAVVETKRYERTERNVVKWSSRVGDSGVLPREIESKTVKENDIAELVVSFEARETDTKFYILDTVLEAVCVLEKGSKEQVDDSDTGMQRQVIVFDKPYREFITNVANKLMDSF